MPAPKPPPSPQRGGAAANAHAPIPPGGRLGPADSGRGAPPPPSSAGGPGPGGGYDIVDDSSSVDFDDLLDGKYRLIQRLDEGGMGSLYVAHNVALDVHVAVKIIRADLRGAEKRMMAERLLQEARAAARLGHPAIVRMMDFGFAQNGDPYLVMELLKGEDLATALDQRGKLSPSKAVRILLPIANALAAAHDQGIVHRDLKPENIFLSQSPTGQLQPKLIDFGIAKVPRRSKKRLTMVGDALGTPDYMAPEQARGEDVDARADVWGLAIILYETVSGARPFEAPSYHGVLRAIIEGEPTPLAQHGVDDPKLCAIVDRGLRKKPSDRWPSVRALGRALAEWAAAQGFTDDICGTSLRSAWLGEAGEGLDPLASMPPPASGSSAAEVVLIPEARAPLGSPAPPSAGPPASAEKAPSLGTPKPAAPSPPATGDAASALQPATAAVAPQRQSLAPDAKRRQHGVAKSSFGRPTAALVLFWILALTGVVAAVTGWLDVPLPGIPNRIPEFWR